MTSESWMRRASCRGLDPALFFPERGEKVDDARLVCAVCPVRIECLDYALNTPVGGPNYRQRMTGIWGGTSSRERAKLRRGRRP